MSTLLTSMWLIILLACSFAYFVNTLVKVCTVLDLTHHNFSWKHGSIPVSRDQSTTPPLLDLTTTYERDMWWGTSRASKLLDKYTTFSHCLFNKSTTIFHGLYWLISTHIEMSSKCSKLKLNREPPNKTRLERESATITSFPWSVVLSTNQNARNRSVLVKAIIDIADQR